MAIDQSHPPPCPASHGSTDRSHSAILRPTLDSVWGARYNPHS
jgi:hypothetical protein